MAKYNNKPLFFAIVAVGLIVAILGWLLLRRPEVLWRADSGRGGFVDRCAQRTDLNLKSIAGNVKFVKNLG